MMIDNVNSVIESILFAAGEPVSVEKLSDALEMDIESTKHVLNQMIKNYESKNRGIMLREIDGSYQLGTKPENYNYVKRIITERKQQELSKAAFETLAIIAYNQPTTKSKIDKIRGVSSEKAIQTLLDRDLICEAGRLDMIGRPILYKVTQEFFRSFGIKSIYDLPVLDVPDFRDEDIEGMQMTIISDRN